MMVTNICEMKNDLLLGDKTVTPGASETEVAASD